jgi:hypothetical protein
MDNKDICCGCGHPTTDSVHCEDCWNALTDERDGFVYALDNLQQTIDKLEEENQRLREELNAERRNSR